MKFALADLFECVVDHVGEREAVVCGNRRFTYDELDERANRLGHALLDRDLAPGDHVALQMLNRPEHAEAYLACFKARLVPLNVNWRYGPEELGHVFGDGEVVAVVHDGRFSDAVEGARRDGRPWSLDVDDGYEALLEGADPSRDFEPRSPDDHYVLYTGGTTGLPKGVVWRQEDIFFVVMGGGNPGGPAIERPEDIGPSVVRNRALRLGPFLGPDEPQPDQFVQLALGPMAHASGQWSTLGTLLGGGRVVLYPEPHVEMATVLDLIEQEQVVSLNLVGDANARPLLATLAAEPGRWDTSSVRLMGSGGAMLSGDVKAQLMEAFPRLAAITEAVGSSEAPVQAVSLTTRHATPLPSLRFPPRDGTRVVTDDGRDVEPGSGQTGRLATRGRGPLGYHADPERSARTFVELDGERWTLPGDMATVEADGSIRLLGRGSLCINTGGEKVYPEEVEAVLVSHPTVTDALVVGIPDDTYGERVAAVVQPSDPAAPPGLDELQDHARDHLAGYKLPRSLTIVDQVRRSPAGKGDYAWAKETAQS